MGAPAHGGKEFKGTAVVSGETADSTWGPILVRTRPQRGGVTPPPPSTDPKMVVQNNGFCGRWRRRRFCFRHTAGGNLVRPYVSALKILRILWRIQKWMKSTNRDFDPDPTSGSDLG